MKKTILLHGATNWKSSNYGDFIYGELLYHHIVSQGYRVLFWQPSAYFKSKIKGYIDETEQIKMESKALVYIPGGYFGEGHNPKFIENIIHFIRFMPIGLKFLKKNKEICVVGIGAGPNKTFFLTKPIKKICNKAAFVAVRDHVSFNAIKTLCPRANLYECSDLIIALSSHLKRNDDSQQINTLFANVKKKTILVHYNTDRTALSLFASTLKIFCKEHPEYRVIVSSDNVLKKENELFDNFVFEFEDNCMHFIYNDPAEMTSLLSKVDVVLTCKLHVGVVACIFNKSVIVAAVHPEKTQRFYNQIGESKRCVSLFETNKEELVEILTQYHEKKIHIPESEIMKAEKNWELLDGFLKHFA